VKDSERKQALQITGVASEVTEDDLERVNTLYGNKSKSMVISLNGSQRSGLAAQMAEPIG
jgi:phage gp45-like